MVITQLDRSRPLRCPIKGNPARYGYCSALRPEDDTLLWQGVASAGIGWHPVTDGDTMVVARCRA